MDSGADQCTFSEYLIVFSESGLGGREELLGVLGFGFWVSCSGFRVLGSGFRVLGSGCRVERDVMSAFEG